MRARDLVTDLERNGAPEIEAGALDDFRTPRDLVRYLTGLDPADRPTDPAAIRSELATALMRPDANGTTPVVGLLDPQAPRETWRRLRERIGVDRWPAIDERPVLGPIALGIIAIVPFLIALAAWFITQAAVVAILSGLLATGWIAGFVLNRMSERRVTPRPKTLTLDQLASQVATRRLELAAMPVETFTPERVEARLRDVLGRHGSPDLDRPFHA